MSYQRYAALNDPIPRWHGCCSLPGEGLADLDGDGTPNYLDTDADGDGIDDADELADGTDPFDAASPGVGLPVGSAALLMLVLVFLATIGVGRLRHVMAR